ncbi:hypothetical protein [Reichenbachiella sp.]|uniref:hypothetical protein n=1 Tax=Reichenbachiella sp. TaxID=2184521 RepID=UPI003BB174F3
MFVDQERGCLECGSTLFGRADKKFCSNKCRNGYNNRITSDATNFIRNTNNALRRNRRILVTLNPSGTTKVKKQELEDKGFDFELITNYQTSKAGKEYRYCYDQGYMILDDTTVLIVESKL